MGGVDKGLQPLRGKPMAQWAIERLAPQVDELLINCNQNLEAYARFGLRLVPDEIRGFAGPLAGLHAAQQAAPHPLVVTVPCDSPFLPDDLVSRLMKNIEGRDLAVA
jgi:molybdopterin-guanine dinucleotide biosynthesis protein A